MTVRAPAITASLPAAVIETDLGWAGIALAPGGIRHATLFHPTRDAALGELRAFGGREADSDALRQACARLLDYARGDLAALAAFPVDLPPELPIASRRVLLALRDIPPGETRSYAWLAARAGLGSGAARAAGAIIGANPAPLWLPCHRIVAADGTLHGFAGGLALKRRLLEHEGALPRSLLP
ncbi:methylated-DNA--[protein]-cysteine S-methyltransferase [Tepidiforma thermophila]|uniref:Methylated-DNA-[protein]-cysteine S-methyltransferase n=1 Tax=Tepidiforma thermophila (strain KCTC 52669 / CGMCC 1.13589 / G233) TaxID=2761530 RepID=A0A2A9HGU2_TEPT2|nr:methylated-DNA--[protein]-cysteine S-methyltransferase [Tepidiforma thermophila]PFG74039.1 methylated-DNA-[protein]-cysteine S-methyltransferase [Tepidiforma thermophila]